MPGERLSMRKIRELLRLRWEQQLPYVFLAKGSTLPSVEDRQRNRPAIATTAAFMITGIGVHDPPEFAFHNQLEVGVHDRPD